MARLRNSSRVPSTARVGFERARLLLDGRRRRRQLVTVRPPSAEGSRAKMIVQISSRARAVAVALDVVVGVLVRCARWTRRVPGQAQFVPAVGALRKSIGRSRVNFGRRSRGGRRLKLRYVSCASCAQIMALICKLASLFLVQHNYRTLAGARLFDGPAQKVDCFHRPPRRAADRDDAASLARPIIGAGAGAARGRQLKEAADDLGRRRHALAALPHERPGASRPLN